MATAQQTFFDDVAAATAIPELAKGPLSEPILMRWSAAIENWHRIHYDRDFAISHDKLPNLAINGTLKQQFVVQCLRRWAGPAGWLWKVSFQFRALNLVGETLRIWARISDKRELADYGLVDLELGILNDVDRESTPGTAVVALPYRNRGAGVPYPFVPPHESVIS
ncbi:MAG TPA: acyl dehydratase [Xanthobacteraceae bacterium]|nr:acyl dehydratase [Xanthobacteraceae bacterium]